MRHDSLQFLPSVFDSPTDCPLNLCLSLLVGITQLFVLSFKRRQLALALAFKALKLPSGVLLKLSACIKLRFKFYIYRSYVPVPIVNLSVQGRVLVFFAIHTRRENALYRIFQTQLDLEFFEFLIFPADIVMIDLLQIPIFGDNPSEEGV